MRGDYPQQPPLLRNSYGFDQVPNSRAFPNFQPPQGQVDRNFQEPQRNISSMIKNLESKIQGIQSLASIKRANCSVGYPEAEPSHLRKIVNEPPRQQIRQYAGLPQEMRGIDLRGSCPNIYKRENMRNTINITQRAPVVPFLRKQVSPKKINQVISEENHLHSFSKNNMQSVSLKDTERPVKILTPLNGEKLNFNNSSIATAVIYKAVPDKPQFNSLNDILVNKDAIKNKTSEIAKKKGNIVGGFKLGKILGKGKFGQVYIAKHMQTGFIVALKKIVKSKVEQYKMIEQLKNEIRLHSSLIHPNIVRFFGILQQPDSIYLIMEYMNGGTLFDYLSEKETLSLKEAVEFLRDTITALQYLHDRSIAHRDIKPENIVLSSQGVAKMCDFGWSALVEKSRKTYCGTFDYAPPEILERKNYDASVDIWCIGVLTYELLTGKVPFEGEKRNIVMEKIINVDKNTLEFPDQMHEDARNFIESLVRKDPEERPKCKELLKYALFVNNPSTSKQKKSVA